MMLPVPTTADLAAFSGRPVLTYGGFVDQALKQATLMFAVATGLEEWPDDPELTQVGEYAILEMADKLFLEQPYQADKVSPYQSETVGSWTYSKSSGINKSTTGGQGTGLFWWDMAMDLLGQKSSAVTASGSIAVAFEGIVEGPDGLRIEDPDLQQGPDRPPYVRIS